MKNLICQECPNGCNLALEWEDAENVFIAGNKCVSGIVYAASTTQAVQEITDWVIGIELSY